MKNNTIVLLVGPSNCGKSTFADRMIEKYSSDGVSAVKISSDEIRRELLCNHKESKMSARMMSVSSQAFQLLNQRVEFHCSYPINTSVIIVDTTGLSQEFRNEMIEIATRNQYNIAMYVFNYERNVLEKFVEASGDGDMFVTGRHSKKLREEVMPNLNRKAYSHVTIFKNPEEASSYRFTKIEGYLPIRIHEKDVVAVIGDVHECVDELTELVSSKLPANVNHVVFLGDIFDKGGKTKETIDYIHYLKHELRSLGIFVYFIKGNHERYVYKRLTGVLQENAELESKFFQSYTVFQSDPDAMAKFIELFDEMRDVLTFHRGKEKSITMTHAPCQNLYLDKSDSKSSAKQINFYFKNREDHLMLEELKFVEDEANYNHPWHLFGHVAHDGRTPKMIKNKIFMDTGCVHGGKLSAAIFNGRHVDFVSVNSTREVDGMISLDKKESNLEKVMRSDIKLSDEDEKIVRRVIKGGAKFVSGTMAPAPSVGLDLESLDAGLGMFGDCKVVIQPKYMGSRCQFYMYKDRSKNFATSRNGFRIRVPGIEECISKYQDYIEPRLPEFKDEVIVDGELLPWATLGKGLIEGSFNAYHAAAKYAVTELDSDPVFQKFVMAEKMNTKQLLVNIEKFDNQMAIYGKESEMQFKGFTVLSIDGEFIDNASWFSVINEDADKSIVIDPKNPDDVKRVRELFERLTVSEGFEGIVIKPLDPDAKTPPYIKVRNKEYLRLVYGFDYTSRLEDLCKQKSINNKLRLSINEYDLGVAMLKAQTKEERDHLIAAMFGQIAKEKSLDPRL